MEPSRETFQEIGRLCSAWAALELHTEKTVWGIIGADDKLGPTITWRLDLRARWELILSHASRKHTEADIQELKAINKWLVTITRDRNIIVHGLIQALAAGRPDDEGKYGDTVGEVGEPLPFVRPPCWVIYRGAEAGKNFPVSTNAVVVVRTNIDKASDRLLRFNRRVGYTVSSTWGLEVEASWPKPIE